MTTTPLEQALLDVLFSFAQADRPADLRLIARLLQSTQRDVLIAAWQLSQEGLVVTATGALTPAGMARAAELRRRTSERWGERARAA